ncbi:MAG: DUF2156 domain-containing protein [Candidatus Andersenbacteria bacterium]|nr:DUF2156 domain-containing protein [Candidatus Andersenbacteria bacterium]
MAMIPEFPRFKKLEITDKPIIENFTKQYPPYSDYNFTSLWSWNTKDEAQVSILNGSLVIKFTDYITGEPFYSFLGSNETDNTVRRLLRWVKNTGATPILKLLPEYSIHNINSRDIITSEDSNNFDYILSVPDLMTYKGNKLGAKRNFVNRFKKKYRSTTHILNLSDEIVQEKIKDLFLLWAKHKSFSHEDIENEFAALSRVFTVAQCSQFITVGILSNENLIGFSINEIVGNGYAILHFEKADTVSYVGIYPYVMQETAKAIFSQECEFLNYEQDLGIPGLKKCKESYQPCAYLKKYILTVQDSAFSSI